MIKYFYATKSNTNENSESSTINNSNRKVYLVMELMQGSLSNILETKREMLYYFHIDVIYQICKRDVLFTWHANCPLRAKAKKYAT